MAAFVKEVVRDNLDNVPNPPALGTLVLAVSGSVPAGNTVVVMASGHSSGGKSIEDSQSNVWNELRVGGGIAGWASQIENPLTTSDTITVEFEVTESISAIGCEFSGTGGLLAGMDDDSTTAFAVNLDITPAIYSQMLVAGLHIRANGATFTPDAGDGFTFRTREISDGGSNETSSTLYFAYKLQEGDTPQNFSGTSDTLTWAGFVAGIYDAEYAFGSGVPTGVEIATFTHTLVSR